MMVVAVLATVIINIMLSQQRSTYHEVSRIQAFYAGKAAMVYTLEQLRTGAWASNPAGGANKFACMRACTPGIVATAGYIIPTDPDIPYRISVIIHPLGSGISGTAQIEVITDYTHYMYNP